MILRSRACYCLVNLAAGKPWRLYFQRYHLGILAVNPNVYIFPLKPCIHLFNLFFFFPFAVSAAARAIAVSDEKADSMRVTWQRAPGSVVNYRVTYRPKAGGRQLATKVAAGKTTTMLRNLTSLTTYEITVLPIYRSGEGKAREGEGTTRTLVTHSAQTFLLPNSWSPPPWMTSPSLAKVPVWPWKISNLSFLVAFFSFIVTPYKSPRNLQTSEPSRTSFRVTWDAAPGDVRGYKVIFHPVDDEINLSELTVGPYDNTVVLEELRCVFRVCRLSQLILNDSTRTPCLKYPLLSWCAEPEPNTQWMCLVCLMEERVCHWPEKSIPPSLMNQTSLFIIQVRKIVFYPFITYIQSEFYTHF